MTAPGKCGQAPAIAGSAAWRGRRKFSVETMVIGMIVWMVIRMIVGVVVRMVVGVIVRMVVRMVVTVVVGTAVWIITVDAFHLGKR